MKKELDEALCKDFPLIFRNRHTPRTLMCGGFDCDDGWEPIIRTLCETLMSEVYSLEQDVSMYERWLEKKIDVTRKESILKTLEDTKDKLDKAKDQVPVALQVKQKFGGLRFYVNRASDLQHGLIRFAELMSYKTCEVCGSMQGAQLYETKWHKVLCPQHAKELNYI